MKTQMGRLCGTCFRYPGIILEKWSPRSDVQALNEQCLHLQAIILSSSKHQTMVAVCSTSTTADCDAFWWPTQYISSFSLFISLMTLIPSRLQYHSISPATADASTWSWGNANFITILEVREVFKRCRTDGRFPVAPLLTTEGLGQTLLGHRPTRLYAPAFRSTDWPHKSSTWTLYVFQGPVAKHSSPALRTFDPLNTNASFLRDSFLCPWTKPFHFNTHNTDTR